MWSGSVLTDEVREAIVSHARREAPRESCGVVIVQKGKAKYIECKNISVEPAEFFVLDPEDFAAAEDKGEVTCIVHSHGNAPATPSDADRAGCENSELPWVIASAVSGDFVTIEPTGYEPPLVGRIFTHGIFDCYGVIRDFYKQKRDIALPNFFREDNWWLKGGNLYVENFATAGFERISDSAPLEVGDVLLMQIASPVPNHAAVWLGDNLILQHLYNRLSSIDVYGGYWQKITVAHLRYKGASNAP